jgi:hypothetical protein
MWDGSDPCGPWSCMRGRQLGKDCQGDSPLACDAVFSPPPTSHRGQPGNEAALGSLGAWHREPAGLSPPLLSVGDSNEHGDASPVAGFSVEQVCVDGGATGVCWFALVFSYYKRGRESESESERERVSERGTDRQTDKKRQRQTQTQGQP